MPALRGDLGDGQQSGGSSQSRSLISPSFLSLNGLERGRDAASHAATSRPRGAQHAVAGSREPGVVRGDNRRQMITPRASLVTGHGSDSAVCSSRSPVGSSASEHGRPHDERARDRHALLFPARQHAGPVRQTLAQTDAPERTRPPGGASATTRSLRCASGIATFSIASNSGSK